MPFSKSQNIYLHILTSDVKLKSLDPMFLHVMNLLITMRIQNSVVTLSNENNVSFSYCYNKSPQNSQIKTISIYSCSLVPCSAGAFSWSLLGQLWHLQICSFVLDSYLFGACQLYAGPECVLIKTISPLSVVSASAAVAVGMLKRYMLRPKLST